MTTYNQIVTGQEGVLFSSSLPSNNVHESRRLNTRGNSRRPMTGHELRRLRLKRSAILSQQRLYRQTCQTESLRQIPEENEAAFHERSRNRAIESIYLDLAVEDIYKDIHNEGIFFVFEENHSIATEGSSGTAVTENSSSIGQEHELIVTKVPSPTPSSCSSEIEPVSSDEETKEEKNIEVDVNTINAVNTVVSSAPSCSFIELDMLQSDNQDNFEQILKDHEDQRAQKLVTETKCDHIPDNELYNNSVRSRDSLDTTSVCTSRSIDTFGFAKQSHAAKGNFEQILAEHEDQRTQKFVADTKYERATDNEIYNTSVRSSDLRDASSVCTSRSIDTFGFDTYGFAKPGQAVMNEKLATPSLLQNESSSLQDFGATTKQSPSTNIKTIVKCIADGKNPSSTKGNINSLENISSKRSLDSLGFESDSAPVSHPAPVVKPSNGNEAQSSSKVYSNPREEQKQSQEVNCVRLDNAGDNVSFTGSVKYTKSSMMMSRARRLRTLRLRATANNRNWDTDDAYHVDHHQFFEIAEGEEAKQPYDAMELPGHFGQIIRVHSGEEKDVSCQSVISEISIMSEKIFRRVSPKLESIIDEINSVCGGVVVPDGDGSESAVSWNSEDEYQKQMESEEIEGENVTDPPYDFDASMKTPPRHFFYPEIQELHKQKDTTGIFRDPCSEHVGEDVLHSISRPDNETRPTRPKSYNTNLSDTNTVPAGDIPSVSRSDEEDLGGSIEEDEKEKQTVGIFRRILCLVDDTDDCDEISETSRKFAILWGDGSPSVKDSDTADLKITRTFSTEEDDYASYYTGNSEEEIQVLERDAVVHSKEKERIQPSSQPETKICHSSEQLELLLPFESERRPRQIECRVYSC